MISIRVENKDPMDIVRIVNAMRAEGMVQGQDFDFAYYRRHWDGMTGEVPQHTVFTFYSEQLASWFGIKWL